MKILRITGKILSILLTVVLGIMLAFNLYTIAARYVTGELQPDVFGFSVAVVISGSMSDEIDVNDMVVIREKKSYDLGDVITFKSDGSLVTHRIIDQTDRGFITKGDANNSADIDPVPQNGVVGKVVLVIPKIGAAIEFMRTPLGMTCLVVFGFALIELPALLRRKSEETGGVTDDKNQTTG